MATLWIREFASVFAASALGAPDEPGVDQTPLTYSATASSAAFAAGTRYIGIISDGAFHYKVGSGAISATLSNLKVPANTLYFMGVVPGHKIAAIAAV